MMKEKRSILRFAERFEGDKVVWMILLLLIMFSFLVIFSSTSQLLRPGETRLDLVRKQLIIAGGGLAIVLMCFYFLNYNRLRFISMLCFPISLTLGLCLALKIDTPILKAETLNEATRVLKFAGRIQIHVFEITKVAMVMYISWALTAVKNLKILPSLPDMRWRKALLIFAPVILICLIMIWCGSTSGAIFLGGVLLLCVLLGSPDIKDSLILMLLGLIGISLAVGIYFISDGKMFGRFDTVFNRVDNSVDKEERFIQAPFGSIEYYSLLDDIRQMNSAKIAIHEGGLIGKGPGQSTQRYVVPIYSEDYVFSFIIEEYGLLGGIILLLLYVSLLARGSLIVRNCDDRYGKIVVAGLVLLITGQAMMHMIINCDIGILTGQTLPMVSHGNSAFICFCGAFGVILCISRLSWQSMKKMMDDAAPLIDIDHGDMFENDDFEEE